MKYKLILFIILLFAVDISAQTPADSLWQLAGKLATPAEKTKVHQQLALYWSREQQPDSVKQHIGATLSYAQKAGHDVLSENLISASRILVSIGDFDYAQQLNDQYLIRFKEENNSLGIATCYFNTGKIQLFLGQIEEAGRSLSQAYKLAEKNRPLRSAISIDLGAVYKRQSRYTDALQILTDALTVTDSVKSSRDYCGLLFTIGTTYAQINDHQAALGYFQRVRAISGNSGDVMGEANALTNIASAYNNLDQNALAETNARKALDIVKGKNLMAEAEVLSVLTDILLKGNNYSGLRPLYQRMYELGNLTGNDFYNHLADIGVAGLAYNEGDYTNAIVTLNRALPRLEQQGGWAETLPGYQLLYKSYSQTGDYKNALSAIEKFYSYRDSTYNQDKIKELASFQSKLDFQKKELELNAQKKLRNIVIVSLVFIFFLSAIAAIVIFKNRQKINRHKQQLLHSKLEIAEQNLQNSELRLKDFASRIQEKTKMLDAMEQQLASLHDNDSKLLVQLQQATILTEEDWQDFKILFEQVHSGFLHRLKEKYPEVSPAETRYLSLTKLNFSTKEMAAALGVSPQSIRTNWYRIRKKLDLSESLTAEELVAEI